MTDHRPLLFLDTNAVHFARLYIEFAKAKDLAPLGGRPDDPLEEIKNEFVGSTQTSYKRGHDLVNYLREQTDLDARIEYSPVTRSELACGLLRGKAILEAAGEGYANRMWTRMDEKEILASLTSDHFSDISYVVNELDTQFADAGIDLAASDPKEMRDIWSLAPQILGIVFLDLGDCAVYASALLAEADELVTADRYLKEVATYMENPGGATPTQEAFYRDANKKLKTVLTTIRSRKITEVKLPKAPRKW